jgi:hypothetical protein
MRRVRRKLPKKQKEKKYTGGINGVACDIVHGVEDEEVEVET